MLRLIVICASLLVWMIEAKTEHEIKADFIKLGIECTKGHPVNAEEMESMHVKHILPDSDNARCLLACVYRKAEWMDDKGMFNVEKAKEISNEHDEQHKKDNSIKLLELCAKVNEESITDGDKGCQRAGHLFTCLTENVTKFGFFL